MMADRPKLLDLFCKAGGASMGYHRAGFDVTGVDREAQKRYPFRFIQADALEYLAECGGCYDVIAASPPCQPFTVMRHFTTKKYDDLIVPLRDLLQRSGRPYVIENVPGAPLICPLILCGSMFGLQTDCGAQLRRHRLFESNYLLMSPGSCRHGETTIAVQGHQATNEAQRRVARRETISVCGDTPHNLRTWRSGPRGMRTITVVGQKPKDAGMERRKYRPVTVTGSTPQQNTVHNTTRETFSVVEARVAMGIGWMVMRELSQAVPPAYTEWIGLQFRQITG